MGMHIDEKENMKNKINKMKDEIARMNKEIQRNRREKNQQNGGAAPKTN